LPTSHRYAAAPSNPAAMLGNEKSTLSPVVKLWAAKLSMACPPAFLYWLFISRGIW